MFADHPLRKKAFLEEKNIDFTEWTYWDCFEGVNPWFCSKIGKSSSKFDFGQMSFEIMFDNHPSRKQAFLDYTNIDFTQWPYCDFFKGVNPWFWSKIGNFIFAGFWTNITLEKIYRLMIIYLKKNTSSPRLSKYESFYSCHNLFFQRGYPMI